MVEKSVFNYVEKVDCAIMNMIGDYRLYEKDCLFRLNYLDDHGVKPFFSAGKSAKNAK